MTIDDKKLKELLSKMEIPRSDRGVKNAAFSDALKEFENNQKIIQGIHTPTRLTGNRSRMERIINLITGTAMNKTQLSKGLTLASVLAVSIFAGVHVYETKQFQDRAVKTETGYENVLADQMVEVGEKSKLAKNQEGVSKDLIRPAVHLEEKADTLAGADVDRQIADEGAVNEIREAEVNSQLNQVFDKAAIEQKAERAAPETYSRAKEMEAKKADGGSHSPEVVAPANLAGSVAYDQVARQNVAAEMAASSIAQRILANKTHMIAPAPGTPGAVPPSYPYIHYPTPPQAISGDNFKQFESNPFIATDENSVSTFSVDVDTASYSYVRQALNNGTLPNRNSIRVEEMVNYFDYNYPLPESRSTPFKPTVAIYPTPWNKNSKLIHIGIKGYEIEKTKKPRSNLVFLIDTSGSMAQEDKLPLLKKAFTMLVNTLEPNDTVGIVTYAGTSGIALEPTKVSEKSKILSVIESLNPYGSTAGEAGIQGAYDLAQRNFNSENVNRVILATDGDFNVGMSDPEQLKKLVEQKRESGIFLSVLGFGEGNYNDAIMQSLAQNGNGNAAYIDSLNEARKVLVEEAGSTIFPIAKDVKLQVEFNPAKVSEYKLVGYETRALKREDFNNDRVDAGEIGSGHSVTAIYEVVTTDSEHRSVDPLRYGKEKEVEKKVSDSNFKDEYGFLKIRYKLPNENNSKLITQPLTKALESNDIMKVNPDLRFASSVASFALLLRNDISTSDISYDAIISQAESARGEDRFGYRQEFINMVKNSKYLVQPQNSGQSDNGSAPQQYDHRY